MVEKFRQIIGNSAKHCLAFSAGTWPQTILPRISQSTLVQAALRETYCVTKTSNSTRRQRYKHITKLPIHMIGSLHIFTNLFHQFFTLILRNICFERFFQLIKIEDKKPFGPKKLLPNWEIFVIFMEKNGGNIWWADHS